ncbi:uncharacterized protein LTR77_009225 [Saxophila tyrrhenica]|uniref:Heterokaryon incompatibility domain-containing protein n=1 Tax=Saxophila tyrrhenica TaxID=1690608 RepID=A0AAV9P2D9_9PEZI|nr:hypothetical protein LTR77_009225 [Saxophila tyrrhenica]
MDDPSSVPTPPETPTVPPQKKDTAAELERLSCLIIHAHNERDFEFQGADTQELQAHISPQWKGEIDTGGPRDRPITWEEQTSAWKQRAEEHPDVRFDIRHVSSQVNERSGVAKVYMEMEVSGIGGVTLHAMNELRWRKVERLWLLHYTLDGPTKMKFQYTQLQRGSIRLVRFSQYCTPSFIHVWMEHLPDFRKDTSPYNVLSYSPDDPKYEDLKSIMLNGRSFMVPSTVHEALSAIVEHHRTNEGYWIDRVSINCGDPAERTEQLALMPTIFSHADRVLVWLGPEDDQTEAAFKAMRERAAHCPYPSLEECNAGGEHRVVSSEQEQNAMKSLLARDYFQKAGIRPDVFQKRNGHLICGRFMCEVGLFVHYQRTSVGPSEAAEPGSVL